jgi:hypothetical protein
MYFLCGSDVGGASPLPGDAVSGCGWRIRSSGSVACASGIRGVPVELLCRAPSRSRTCRGSTKRVCFSAAPGERGEQHRSWSCSRPRWHPFLQRFAAGGAGSNTGLSGLHRASGVCPPGMYLFPRPARARSRGRGGKFAGEGLAMNVALEVEGACQGVRFPGGGVVRGALPAAGIGAIRLRFVGANGVGKTTLIKLLAGAA